MTVLRAPAEGSICLAALSLLGVAVALDESAWAGTVSLLALLALAGTLLGYTRHRMLGPIALAASGAGFVLWAMLGSHHWLVGLAALLALAIAAGWDWRLMQSLKKKEDDYGGGSA